MCSEFGMDNIVLHIEGLFDARCENGFNLNDIFKKPSIGNTRAKSKRNATQEKECTESKKGILCI